MIVIRTVIIIEHTALPGGETHNVNHVGVTAARGQFEIYRHEQTENTTVAVSSDFGLQNEQKKKKANSSESRTEQVTVLGGASGIASRRSLESAPRSGSHPFRLLNCLR